MVKEVSLFPVQHCETYCREHFVTHRWRWLSSVCTRSPCYSAELMEHQLSAFVSVKAMRTAHEHKFISLLTEQLEYYSLWPHACIQVSTSVSTHLPLRVMHPSCSISRTYVQLCMATSSSRTAGLNDMDKEVSLSLGRLYGIHFHWQFVIRRYHWLSFARN